MDCICKKSKCKVLHFVYFHELMKSEVKVSCQLLVEEL